MVEELPAPVDPPRKVPTITDVVLLVHGMRTHAAWQVMVAEVLETPTIKVIPIKYGYFNVFRFLSPFEKSRSPPSDWQEQLT